jgi:uncharacterized protein YbjT (DUF2867 family)
LAGEPIGELGNLTAQRLDPAPSLNGLEKDSTNRRTNMGSVIAVTGATGNVGRALAEHLLDAGIGVRAVARGADKLRPLADRGAELRPGSLTDAGFLSEAFRGAAAVFAMVPPHYGAADLREYQRGVADALARAIRDAGVPRVISLSSVGADLDSGTGPIAGLHDLEQRLEAVPDVGVVHLRAAYFMENHLASIPLMKTAGINAGALDGDLPIPMIATRDIAAAAAEYMREPTFRGVRVRYLLGPRDYTVSQSTAMLGAAVGRPDLAYVKSSYADTGKALLGLGISASVAQAFVEMQRAFNEGRIEIEARSASNTTPTTLEEFARAVFVPAFGS